MALQRGAVFLGRGNHGDVGVRNVSTNVDVSFNDILDHLTFGGMLLSEARENRLKFFFAPLYVRLGDHSQQGALGVDVDAAHPTASQNGISIPQKTTLPVRPGSSLWRACAIRMWVWISMPAGH